MLNTGVPSRSKSFREKARERFGLSRNKSRSVDVQRPSTLSSIRSKIQTVSATFKDSVSSREEDCEVQTRRGRSSRIKVPTTSYTVRPTDTVFSIAAQFNITPAEVSALNRLSHSSELFPEQVIRVPDVDALAELEKQREAEREEERARERERQAANNLATSPRAGPGIAARITPSSPLASSPHSFLNRSCSTNSSGSNAAGDCAAPARFEHCLSTEESVRERQFVKSEHARLITDGEGCVSGTLIITPQTLMFDPSLRDRLVQERGQAFFQWQIQLRQVRTVAVYNDARAMRLMVGDSAKIEDPDLNEAEMRMELSEENHRFVVSADKSEGTASGPEKTSEVAEDVKEERTEDVGVKEEEKEDVKEEKSEDKEVKGLKEKEKEEEKEEKEEKEEEKEEKEVEVEEKKKVDEREDDKEEEAKDDMKDETKEGESNDETKGECKERGKEADDGNKTNSDGDEVEVEVTIDTEEPEVKTESFVEAHPILPNDSQLDYLCILYKPTSPACCPPSQQPRLPDRGQHWFTLPNEKSKELLAFLKDSSPEELNAGASAAVPIPTGGCCGNGGGERFFVLQENHFALTPPESEDARHKRLRTIRQESLDWELVNREEVHGAAKEAGLGAGPSIDEEMLIPTLIGEAVILKDWMLKDIVANLPSRAEGCLSMELAYSTHVHGFSLLSLYRKCKREEDKPCVLLIRTQKCPPDVCFGALLASGIRVSDHFYGTGETYLMRWSPKFEKFLWSGNNNYIIRCGSKSIMIGSSSGASALFIDEALYRGRSQACDTFLLPFSLTIGGEEDFIIENLEVWDFK